MLPIDLHLSASRPLMTPQPAHPQKDTVHFIKEYREKSITLMRYPLNHTDDPIKPHTVRGTKVKKTKYLKLSKITLAQIMKMKKANKVGTFKFTPKETLVNETTPKLSSAYRTQHGLPKIMSGIHDDFDTRIRRLNTFCTSNKMKNLFCKKDSDDCMYDRIFVDENHKVVFCAIPKVASTVWLMKLLEMANKPFNPFIAKAWTALAE